MPAGKTGRGEVGGVGDDVWPGSVEEHLKNGAEKKSPEHGTDDEKGHAPLAVKEQKAGGEKGYQNQGSRTAQRSNIARRFQQPSRTFRRKIGPPHGQHQVS